MLSCPKVVLDGFVPQIEKGWPIDAQKLLGEPLNFLCWILVDSLERPLVDNKGKGWKLAIVISWPHDSGFCFSEIVTCLILSGHFIIHSFSMPFNWYASYVNLHFCICNSPNIFYTTFIRSTPPFNDLHTNFSLMG